MIDARTPAKEPHRPSFVDVDVLWADGNKSGDSTSSTVPSDGDDGVHPSGKDDSSSWTTATVQATSSADASPVVAGSVDSFSLTSTISETMLPIDLFLTPASSICSQQNYEILKASLLLLLRSRQRYIDWTGGWTACWLSPFPLGNQLPFHHHLFPRLVSIGSFFHPCRLFLFFLFLLQDNLLLYDHARLSSMEDGHSNAGSKDYLVSLMFSHYDLNNNGLLEAQQLTKVILRSARH